MQNRKKKFNTRAATLTMAALAIVLAEVAIAQPAPPSQPNKPFPVTEAPPSTPGQPGVLEGRLPPTTARRDVQGPAPQGGAAPVDTLLARNATGAATWVTVYQGTFSPFGVCLPPNTARDLLVARGVPTRIRAESTRDLACEQRDDGCDTSIDLRPGMNGMELRGAGKACQWQAANEGMLRRVQPAVFRAVNTTNYWLWLTEYAKKGDPVFGLPVVDKAVGTLCIAPRGSADIKVYNFDMPRGINGGRRFWSMYRAEFTTGANCAHPRVCDTGIASMEWYQGSDPFPMYGRYDPAGDRNIPPFMRRPCWWGFTPT
jgi:hypothetical protein